MNVAKLSCTAALALCAGSALAQPASITVNGVKDAAYGEPKFVQNQPTAFGDNQPTGLGNPQDVASGVEIRIKLADIGNPTGVIGLCAFVNGGGSGYISNQVIGSLPANIGNLGNPKAVNFSSLAGAQNVSINLASLPVATPTMDGQRDAAYSVIASQGNYTGFGNATHGNVSTGGGSELDNISACVDATYLYIFAAGNLEANGNTLDCFLDTTSGGQNRLLGGSGSGRLNTMGDDGSGNGLTFDTGFDPDFYFGINGDGTNIYVDAGQIPNTAGGTGWYCGLTSPYGANPVYTPGDVGAPDVQAAIDNSNVGGVPGAPTQIPSEDYANGSEIDAVYGRKIGRWICLMVTGNLETSYNKLDMFFDVQDGGQHSLRGDNVDIDYNGLNRMGQGGNGFGNPDAGLTFDIPSDSFYGSTFDADYWVGITNGLDGSNVNIFANAAVLRTDGPVKNFSGQNLDYGAYDGGNKTVYNPIGFNGTNLTQPGSDPNIYTNFAPRTAGLNYINSNGADPNVGVPGLLLADINNLNILGVTGSDADYNAAAAVTTGMEIVIAGDEAGLASDPGQPLPPIKVAGFINGSSHDYVSSQVFGGLPSAGNLGEVTYVDFSQIAGDQFVVICPADVDGSGFVDFDDYNYFVAKFEAGDDEADFDCSGFVDFDDFNKFVANYEYGC